MTTGDIFIILQLIVFDAVFFIVVSGSSGGFWFNPKYNYKEWYNLNWFGVGFVTVLYWISFLPFTLIVLIGWLFTVGRK